MAATNIDASSHRQRPRLDSRAGSSPAGGAGKVASIHVAPTATRPSPWLWASFAVVTLVMLGLNVPWRPALRASDGAIDYFDPFDYSWMRVLHDALATGKQFGAQIILPYGPLGFLAAAVYDPRTYLILIVCRVVIAMIVIAGLWRLARRLHMAVWLALPWGVAITLLMAGSPDHFFAIASVLLLANAFADAGGAADAIVFGLIILQAAISLVKVNLCFQSITVMLAITAATLFRRLSQRPTNVEGPFPPASRILLAPACFMAAVAVFYLAVRQSPASIASLIWGWSKVSEGHVESASLTTIGGLIDVFMFLPIALLLLVALGDWAWRVHRRIGLILLGAMALFLLLIYKHSFVRQDFAHATIGPMAVLGAGIIFAPLFWRAADNSIRRWLCIGVIALSAIVSSTSRTTYFDDNLLKFAIASLTDAGRGLLAAVDQALHFSALRDRWLEAEATTRAAFPLPAAKIAGTVDVYPHRQDVLFAYGLDYAPRPAIQSLIATSPSLARADADWLAKPQAADTLLFDIEPVDHDLPALLDGASWPVQLARYDLIDASGAMLVLRKRATPGAWHLEPLATVVGQFDQEIAIPEPGDAPIWAKVHLKRRLDGRILSALYKPPLMTIEIRTHATAPTGKTLVFRLLPPTAEQGFLLSPLIVDRLDYAKLHLPGWRSALHGNCIEYIKISLFNDSPDVWFDPTISIELQKLVIQK